MGLDATGQINAADMLIEGLNERGVGTDVSVRVLIEEMAEAGLTFSTGNQIETLKALDRMDAE